MDFTYRFPVVRGRQAEREYYIAMVPLKMITKLFPDDEEIVPPEFRAQRRLNESRIPVIKKYILDNRDNYVFSALAASIDGEFHFEPDHPGAATGILDVSMDTHFLLNDGQHRKAAIVEALQEDPSLGEETISIVFYEDKGLARSQQIFTDLNKNAVKASNSISELYDSRDLLAVITRNVIMEIEFLNNYTDKERATLGKYSSNLFLLHTFYQANKTIFGTSNIKNMKSSQDFLYKFWNLVTQNMIQWQEIEKKQLQKKDLRENYISSQGVVIQALGRIGHYFYQHPSISMSKNLSDLQNINWKRSSSYWKGRAVGDNGRILTNQRAVALIANEIKKSIHLKLTEEEKRIELDFKETHQED